MKKPENLIFIGDLHGHPELHQAIASRYGADSQLVYVGDYVDGPNEPELLRQLAEESQSEEPPILLLGNHEINRIQVINAAFTVKERDPRPGAPMTAEEMMVRSWVNAPALGKIALPAYGIDPSKYKHPEDPVMRLYEKMQRYRLFDLLMEGYIYYEDDDHIAIHAGLIDQPWSEQSQDLDKLTQELKQRKLGLDPDQAYSMTLADQTDAFAATDKIVITGHSETNLPPEDRITANGKRVRIGSSAIWNGGPAMVYNAREARVEAVEPI